MKIVIAMTMLMLAGACTSSPTPRPIPTPTTGAISAVLPPSIALPTPQLKGKFSLEETLAQRRSVREYAAEELSLAEIGQLLWAAQGITSPTGQRTAPSAGALYPLEVYVVKRDGVFRYDPANHQLRFHLRGDLRHPLFVVCLEQESVKLAPVDFVIAAVYERLAVRYSDRAPRYAHIEAGHAAQNVLLQAVALNLGAVPIGAFDDVQVQRVLSLPADQQPLYVIPVGRRK
jgi:SagB-type dehydrogenase family enzyme